MAIAAERRLMKELVQRDLGFHIALTRAPGTWIGGLRNHRLLLHMIREGNPILAGQCVERGIRFFAASAYAVWENVEASIGAHHNGQRSRGRKG
jgi:hypothetical protein